MKRFGFFPLAYVNGVCRATLGLDLLALALSAQAIPDNQFEPAFDTFVRATAGDSKAIDQAAEAFGSLLKTEPANPVLLAYAGAATTMQARTTLLPWKKMHYAEDGLAMLDKALTLPGAASELPLQRQVPATLEVRFTAASTFLAVPGFMNRGERGARLLGEVLASPLLNSAPLAFRGNVWLSAAKQAAAQGNKDEARKYLDTILRNNAPQAEAARKQLEKLGQ
jgi:tetratricopeptide (TPR) repeat protein